jgi:DNA polymerase III subunit epsilon
VVRWLPNWLRRRRVREALEPEVRARLRLLRKESGKNTVDMLRQPLERARIVAVDLETTGLRMHRDRVLCIGAVAVRARTIRHDDCFERYLRQERASPVDNILIHQIGGQQQLGGVEPVTGLLECLEFLGNSAAVAFRAQFDRTILGRETAAVLGVRLHNPFIDLAVVLPALFPDTANDTLEDWLRHFNFESPARHRALGDAYSHGALLLVVLERATRAGLNTVGDLLGIEKAQRWLGRVR